MLHDVNSDQVRFTKEELKKIKRLAAKNGEVIGEIKNNKEAMEACLKALPPEIQNDMLAFFEKEMAKKDKA